MLLEFTQFEIAGPKLVTPKRFSDNRGFFSETYNSDDLAKIGIDQIFVQDNQALSVLEGTVRGLHFQTAPYAQAKLIRVTRGSILDVAVDIREGSPTYGRHIAVELSAENWTQLYIPKGFAHGYCTLLPNSEIIYKVTSFYAPQYEFGILWNDPDLAIDWPESAGQVVSDKDKKLPRLLDIRYQFFHE